MIVGQRVGILVGLQSASGPHIGQRGTVVRVIRPWGKDEYVVKGDDGQELVYPPYLLTAV